MMGHRGVRLGITYPEVTEMQVRAIFEAAAELIKAGKKVEPEIMVPVTCDVHELEHQKVIFDQRLRGSRRQVRALKTIPHLVGTMIEIPRAACSPTRWPRRAEFFSFGTNDLTQMSFGFCRDDIGGSCSDYLEQEDPAGRSVPDASTRTGVGQLIEMAVERGRTHQAEAEDRHLRRAGRRPALRRVLPPAGLDYVSCSPFRVPIARLAAAHAALNR